MKSKQILTKIKTFCFLFLVVLVLSLIPWSKQEKAEALSIFTPFGGKIESYNPNACADLTNAILGATFGSVLLTVDEVKITNKVLPVGILRLYTVPIIPPVVRFLGFGMYAYLNPLSLPSLYTIPVPQTWALGLSFDLLQSGLIDKFSNGSVPGADADGNPVSYSLEALLKSVPCKPIANMAAVIGTGFLPAI